MTMQLHSACTGSRPSSGKGSRLLAQSWHRKASGSAVKVPVAVVEGRADRVGAAVPSEVEVRVDEKQESALADKEPAPGAEGLGESVLAETVVVLDTDGEAVSVTLEVGEREGGPLREEENAAVADAVAAPELDGGAVGWGVGENAIEAGAERVTFALSVPQTEPLLVALSDGGGDDVKEPLEDLEELPQPV